MYLKSLVLKGFKSFADRSVLNLQPGITAVVGPNGSGKSNISDAVLWVLGERNARNLRGQAMEDVIFAGSAARKPVSVAEVELVLDNSDGTLPVEYDEVSIARRMYRSGESEYLINGVVSRRLDVLDILHDSGLGTGTHSIISQGSLDSILQSKPEDRRALIEEAAGVLKHKQRKEKSARKLAQMDNHLARVHDVVAEVERQLGPLERKAKRAKAYAEASDELSQLRLSLAVDDLRKLKSEWERVCAEETNVSGMVDERRVQVDAAEKRVGDLQELILRESEDAGELARKQRKAASVAERLDSVDMLVREKRRAAQSYVADMEIALESADAKRIGAQEALNAAKVQSEQAEAAYREAQDDADKLSKERYDAAERRREVESRVENAEAELRKLSDDLENAKRSHAEMQELLSNGLAHQKLVDARRTEMQGLLTRATQEHEEAKEALAQKEESLAQMQQRDTEAQKGASEAYARREQAHAQSDAAKRAVKATEAEINAVVQARRAHDAEVPALIWLVDHAADFAGNLAPVAQALKAPADMETMVERLLGEDLSALAVEDANCAETVVSALVDGARVGDVSLVMRKSGRLAQREDARSCQIGHALVDDLTFADSAREVVCALLGDVVVCDSRAQAFDAHSKDAYGLRFVSRDGLVIYPNGKMRVYGAVEGKREGVLARERKLDQLRKRLDEEIKNEAAAAQDAEAADESYREAQEESLHVSQSLAELKGAVQAARDAEKSASERLSSLVREATEIERQLEVAAKTVADLKPDVARLQGEIEQLGEQVSNTREQREALIAQVSPLRSEAGRLSEKFNEAKLKAATLKERMVYAERMVSARSNDLKSLESDSEANREALALKSAVCRRTEPLLAVIGEIALTLHRRAQVLDDALAASESSSSNVHASAALARESARAAHDAFDEANARMTQVRVEKGRLEVQVETAVNVVVKDCATPLERVDDIPVLENRQEAEDRAFKLERRIKNMGAINPDAASEYEALKARYDFIAGQLSDMEQARKSLRRIVRIIDARMKDDFAKTFDQVNKNFAEIFSILFPGGQAYLSFDDPDDIENTGVEVTAQPRGKRLTKMMLMSGGEKSLTALALLFAVYKIRSTPFYILDEVEAALDDTNLRRLVSYVDSLRDSTQMIMITHQRRTMEMADVLFGVSMQADGVTKVVSQKLERALEHAE